MTFFDCVYLKVSKYYSKAENEELNGFSALFVIGTLQMFNVSTLFLIICLIIQEKPPLPSWSFLSVGIVSVFVNGFKYYKISFSTLQEGWDSLSEQKKTLINRLMAIYIVGSTILWFFIIIYFGGKKF
jgi:hypothetical protein